MRHEWVKRTDRVACWVKGTRSAILLLSASAWESGSVTWPRSGRAVEELVGEMVAAAAVANSRQVNCQCRRPSSSSSMSGCAGPVGADAEDVACDSSSKAARYCYCACCCCCCCSSSSSSSYGWPALQVGRPMCWTRGRGGFRRLVTIPTHSGPGGGIIRRDSLRSAQRPLLARKEKGGMRTSTKSSDVCGLRWHID